MFFTAFFTFKLSNLYDILLKFEENQCHIVKTSSVVSFSHQISRQNVQSVLYKQNFVKLFEFHPSINQIPGAHKTKHTYFTQTTQYHRLSPSRECQYSRQAKLTEAGHGCRPMSGRAIQTILRAPIYLYRILTVLRVIRFCCRLLPLGSARGFLNGMLAGIPFINVCNIVCIFC